MRSAPFCFVLDVLVLPRGLCRAWALVLGGACRRGHATGPQPAVRLTDEGTDKTSARACVWLSSERFCLSLEKSCKVLAKALQAGLAKGGGRPIALWTTPAIECVLERAQFFYVLESAVRNAIHPKKLFLPTFLPT